MYAYIVKRNYGLVRYSLIYSTHNVDDSLQKGADDVRILLFSVLIGVDKVLRFVY